MYLYLNEVLKKSNILVPDLFFETIRTPTHINLTQFVIDTLLILRILTLSRQQKNCWRS